MRPLLDLFRRRPPLEAESEAWLLEAFDWCLRNFQPAHFFEHTRLVLPSNDFFPGRADSVEGMARLILEHVKAYAGMAHWPTELADQRVCAPLGRLHDPLPRPLRSAEPTVEPGQGQPLLVPCNPEQINRPEAMIASFAHVLAHYLGQTAAEPPPGGVEYWPHATELLAVYLGFGLMFANSAFTFRGGCGSCYNPRANRDAYLSEREATGALALFAALKGMPARKVGRHLKPHLRGPFSRMVKGMAANAARLAGPAGGRSGQGG